MFCTKGNGENNNKSIKTAVIARILNPEINPILNTEPKTKSKVSKGILGFKLRAFLTEGDRKDSSEGKDNSAPVKTRFKK